MTKSMVDEAARGTPVDFDGASQKGWNFFTKFLFVNVVAAAAVLLFIGALTVWS